MNPRKKMASELLDNISPKIGVTFFTLLLVVILTLLFASSFLFKKILEQNEDRLVKTTANVLVTSLGRVSFSGRFHTQLFADQILQNEKDLVSIHIIDEQNEVLVNSVNPSFKFAEELKIDDLKARLKNSDGYLVEYKVSANGKRYKRVVVPFNVSFDRSSDGVVVLGISTSVFEEQIQSNNLVVLFIGVLVSLFSALIVWWVTKKLSRPINDLALTFRGILDHAPVWVLLYRKDGRIVEVSHSFSDIFLKGRTIPSNLDELFTAEEAAQFPHRSLDTSDNSFFRKELRFDREGIKNHYTSVHFCIALAGKENVYCSMAFNINEEIQMKKELERKTLEAEKASEAKSLFLAMMSHEIRTPLTAIIGFLTLLNETALSERQSYFAKTALSSSDNLLGLVNDILDYSKIESNSIHLESIPFSLTELLAGIGAVFSYQIREKNLKYKLIKSPGLHEWFVGDPMRLRQVLMNLMSNAVKFTSRGEITFEVSLIFDENSPQKKQRILFKVKDTGIGIAPEQLTKVFETFNQGDSSTARRFGGTGLGLSISKRLVELMGGSLIVESELTKGSAFSFELSFEQTESPLKESEPKTLSEELLIKNKSILVVDDDESNRQLIGIYLSALSIQIDFAECGEAALEKFKLKRYDLILMDIQMPGLDGVQTLAKIREFEAEHGMTPIPTFAFTANVFQEQLKEYTNAGFNGCLSKPFRKNDFIFFMRKLLGDKNLGQ